jgi:hypothetical protein
MRIVRATLTIVFVSAAAIMAVTVHSILFHGNLLELGEILRFYASFLPHLASLASLASSATFFGSVCVLVASVSIMAACVSALQHLGGPKAGVRPRRSN